jgi:hypothetical protein
MAGGQITRLMWAACAVAAVLGCHGVGRADPALNRAVQNPNNWAMYGRTIPVNNMCMDMEAKNVAYHRSMFYLGNGFSTPGRADGSDNSSPTIPSHKSPCGKLPGRCRGMAGR